MGAPKRQAEKIPAVLEMEEVKSLLGALDLRERSPCS
jgi:hypothetical protein